MGDLSLNVEVSISSEALIRVIFRSALRELSKQLCTVAAMLLERTFGPDWKTQAISSLQEKDKNNLVEKFDKIPDRKLDLYYVTEILKHFHSEFATHFCSSGGLSNLRDFKATYSTPTAPSFGHFQAPLKT